MEKWVQTVDYKVKQDNVVLNIGDYIDYHDQAGENGTDLYKGRWQVLGASDEGNLLIVSESNVTTHCFNKEHTLEGAMEAYSTAVDTLDKICEVYSSGTGATHARSICVEDIDRLVSYDKTQNSSYGKSYTIKNKKGDIFIWHDGTKWHKTKSNKSVTLTDMYYICNVRKKDILSTKVHDMLFGKGYKNYCLASTCVAVDSTDAIFAIRTVYLNRIACYGLVYSCGNKCLRTCDFGVRAVVTLKSNINITPKDVVVSEWKIN